MKSSAGGGPAPRSGKSPAIWGRRGTPSARSLAQVHAQRASDCRRTACEAAVAAARPVRVDGPGTVGSLSRVDRRAAVGGAAAAGIPRRLYHGPPATRRTASQVGACPRDPLRDGAGSTGPDGLRRSRHRLHRRGPPPRLSVQLCPGPLATPVSAIRRVPGHGDHPERARARLRPSGRCGRNLLV